MNNLPLLNDLRVFMLVARRAGFAAVAEELGVSPAFVSKRIALLEQTLNVVLLHRTTRRVTITEEGAVSYTHLDVYKRQVLLPAAEDMLPIACQMFAEGKTVAVEHAEPVYLRNNVAWKKLPGKE